MRILTVFAKTSMIFSASALLLTGCGGIGIQQSDTNNYEEAQKKPNTTLPAGFPVPIYANATILMVTEVPPLKKGGDKGYIVQLESPDEAQQLFGYYLVTLGKAGWAAKNMPAAGLEDKSLMALKDDKMITISFNRQADKTKAAITLTPVQAAPTGPSGK